VRKKPLSDPGEGCEIVRMAFEWDSNKAATNLVKHGISFDEAKTVFNDPLYVDFYDPNHSDDEHRYIMIGMSAQNRLLLVRIQSVVM
jgi:Uncharacterized protein conserved in bacteria